MLLRLRINLSHTHITTHSHTFEHVRNASVFDSRLVLINQALLSAFPLLLLLPIHVCGIKTRTKHEAVLGGNPYVAAEAQIWGRAKYPLRVNKQARGLACFKHCHSAGIKENIGIKGSECIPDKQTINITIVQCHHIVNTSQAATIFLKAHVFHFQIR